MTTNKLFDILGLLEIESFKLDIQYDEKKEADYIKNSFNEYQKMKPSLDKILQSLKDNWRKSSSKKERGYFG